MKRSNLLDGVTADPTCSGRCVEIAREAELLRSKLVEGHAEQFLTQHVEVRFDDVEVLRTARGVSPCDGQLVFEDGARTSGT